MGSPGDDQPTVVDAPPTVAPTVVDGPPEGPTRTGGSVLPSRSATPAPSTIVTAADAMRDEEVHRTRLFIRLGWGASLGGIGSVPFVDGERAVTVAFIAALVLGMVVSFGFHQAFRDPTRYGPRSMFVLGVMATINTHVAILFYGAFTIAPVLIVIGMHFVGRSELAVRRAIYVAAAASHAAISIALISGVMPDPGVFATARPLGVESYLIGACYVQAAYGLAYYTGKVQRLVSLRSIEQLQRATRVASQRAALLEELRVDLARAEQAGAGRYTDHVIGGYRLGAVLGRGAHGEVYEASLEGSGEPAAVKVLHLENLEDQTLVERFLREAQVTSTLASPHIVRVLGASGPGAPVPFLAMERLRGVTLAELLRRKHQLPPEEVVALVTQIGAALDAARGAAIVHRDLKPQNLMLDGTVWKLLDFGVARLADHEGTLTRGGIVGTPQYMSPEQARGGVLDHRADLYGLGVIAYRALTGRNPFGGSDTPAILYAVVHTMPPRPTSLVELPVDLDRWAARALAKEPTARFDSGAAMSAALIAALRGEFGVAERAAADRLIEDAPWQVVS